MNSATILMILVIIIFIILPSFRDRTIQVRRLLVTPAIFLYLLYKTTTENFSFDFTILALGMLGVFLGVGIGILIRSKTPIKVDRDQQRLWLPGSYINLWTFLAVFAAHFAIGYLRSTQPQLFSEGSLIVYLLLFALVVTSTVTVGSNGCIYYRYRSARSVSLPAEI